MQRRSKMVRFFTTASVLAALSIVCGPLSVAQTKKAEQRTTMTQPPSVMVDDEIESLPKSQTDVFVPLPGSTTKEDHVSWSSSLRVHNPNSSPANVQFFLFKLNQSNPSPAVFNDTIKPGETRRYDQTVETLFDEPGGAVLRVVSDQKLIVRARVEYQKAEGGRRKAEQIQDGVMMNEQGTRDKGQGTEVEGLARQFFAAVPASFAMGAGRKTNLLGTHQSSLLTNRALDVPAGVVEVAGDTVMVKVTAIDEAGNMLASKEYTLAAYEPRPYNLSEFLSGGSASPVKLEVEAVSGSGKVIAFGGDLSKREGIGDRLTASEAVTAKTDDQSDHSADKEKTQQGPVSGSGMAGRVPLWTSSTALGDSVIAQNEQGGLTIGQPDARVDFKLMIGVARTDTESGADGAIMGQSLKGIGVVGLSNGESAGVSGRSTAGVGVEGTSDSEAGVFAMSNSGPGVKARSMSGVGIEGESQSEAGVSGTSANGPGVKGTSDSEAGVMGSSTSGHGVTGTSESKDGVLGQSTSGAGVEGISSSDSGVVGTSTSGAGVEGTSSSGHGVTGLSNSKNGVFGQSTSSNGVRGVSQSSAGVQGQSTSGNGVEGVSSSKSGVRGDSQNSSGVLGLSTNSIGVEGGSTNGHGVVGTSRSFDGVQGLSESGNGVQGITNSGIGVKGSSTSGNGVEGTSPSNNGVRGVSQSSAGVRGESTSGRGVRGFSTSQVGVQGDSTSSIGVGGVSTSGNGVVGLSRGTGDGTAGVLGTCNECVGVAGNSANEEGVFGVSVTQAGVRGEGFFGLAGIGSGGASGRSYGVVGGCGQGVTRCGAALFSGTVEVSGAKLFHIDHPLDPANKFLNHVSVESSDMKNIYDGVVVLDHNGRAVVTLPDWFQALNTDFRYQLTAIGAPGPSLYVAEEIENNRFKIAGGTPGMKVSWQVTGIRHDAWAKANPVAVEEDKSDAERGYYLSPGSFGQPAEKSILRLHQSEPLKLQRKDREAKIMELKTDLQK